MSLALCIKDLLLSLNHFSLLPPTRELAVQEELMCTQGTGGQKPEANLRSKRLVERDGEVLTRLEEIEPVKRAAKLHSTATTFAGQLAEKER